MSEIRVKEGESLESALRRFKRSTARSGVLAEVRKREAGICRTSLAVSALRIMRCCLRYKERTGPHLCEPVLPFLWVNTVIENGGIAAAMAPDYLNLRLRAASDFFLRRTDGFS